MQRSAPVTPAGCLQVEIRQDQREQEQRHDGNEVPEARPVVWSPPSQAEQEHGQAHGIHGWRTSHRASPSERDRGRKITAASAAPGPMPAATVQGTRGSGQEVIGGRGPLEHIPVASGRDP